MTDLKAYVVTWDAMPDIESYYAASTAGKAKYACYLGVSDQRRDTSIIEFRARRVPALDTLARQQQRDGTHLPKRDVYEAMGAKQ